MYLAKTQGPFATLVGAEDTSALNEGILPEEFLTTGISGLVFGSGAHWLFAKTSLLLLLFLWFRATFPRYRYDQIMRLGWKVFIPITIVWLVIEGAAVVAGIGPWFD